MDGPQASGIEAKRRLDPGGSPYFRSPNLFRCDDYVWMMSLKLRAWPARKANPLHKTDGARRQPYSNHHLKFIDFIAFNLRFNMCFHLASQMGWWSQGIHRRTTYSSEANGMMKPIQVAEAFPGMCSRSVLRCCEAHRAWLADIPRMSSPRFLNDPSLDQTKYVSDCQQCGAEKFQLPAGASSIFFFIIGSTCMFRRFLVY